jgi:hypothetical protein
VIAQHENIQLVIFDKTINKKKIKAKGRGKT